MTTDKLNLLEIDLSVPGWDVIFNADIQKLDDAISTIEIREYGETIAAYEAVYIKSDGKYWLAQANGTKQPGFGIAIDAGVATDEKRVRTSGLMENVLWTWTNIGGYIYLGSTDGALTETQPADNAQIMGIIISATEIFVSPGTASVRPLQIGVTFNGTIPASLKLTRMPISGGATFPIDLTGSIFYAETVATASTDLSIEKNGTPFGVATFSIATSLATFVSASGATFADGDILTIVAPGTPDATLADLGLMLVGSRVS